tara:strand:+ start:19441 stop:21675 length:2235 start_codon:yes stop_codon:yes gene_type:complete
MDKESIQKKLYAELDRLGKELNLPEAEINRMKLQYVDIAELTEDPDMLTRLSDDLISSLLYRANQGIPDNIPDDMIVENIPNQPDLNKVESDELENIFGDEKLNPDYDPELGRKGVVGKDYIAKYAEDYAEFADGRITSLPDNHIFVFGSNEAGRHGKGAALDAVNYFGAETGKGFGLQGQSFAIPTKDGQLNVLDNKQIQKYINNFLEFVKNNPDKKFVVTALGTGLAEKNPSEIASMFSEVPDNVILSQKFDIKTKELKSLQTDSKSTDPLGKQLSAKTAVFSEGEYAGRSIEDVWQNTVKNKRTPGTAGKSGKPDGSGLIKPGNMQDSYNAYDDLWKQWFNQNPDIYAQAVAKRKEGYTFIDTFGKKGNVRQDETIMRIIDSDWKPGGSLGAAKLNDPNVFPEKIEEYDPNVHGEFKEKVLDKFNAQEQKFLDYYNNHDVIKTSGLNGESVLLGIVKAFGYDAFEKYNSLSGWNPVKWTGKFSKFLFKGMISVLDPVGEGIETAVKIGTKTGAIKDGTKLSRLGGVASNWKYELKNQAIWQGTAAMLGIVDNAADALNSVLDEYGLLPEFVKERIDVVPYEDLNKHLAHQSRYWQSAGWQGSKLTSLWYNLDTMLPSRMTGNTPHNWAIQKFVGTMLPERFELEADEQDYWDIITGQREFKQNTQDGFFGWWKNEIEQTGQLEQPSYFAQVNNPDLNVYNANSHVDTWNKLNQIKDRFGPGIMDMAGYDINMYNNLVTGDE